MSLIAQQPSSDLLRALFGRYDVGAPYDEMFSAPVPHPHCRPLFESLQASSSAELGRRQSDADKAFLAQGITFTVYGDDQGTERIFPFDLIPGSSLPQSGGRSIAA